MSRIVRLIAAFVAMSGSMVFQASAACTRHFYNKSNFAWSISGYDGPKSSLVIQPNSTAEIPWGAFSTITIGGNISGKPFGRQFKVRMLDGCVFIGHHGPTGPVTLNKFQNGDVTTCAGGC